jgi:hypothetical protein
MVSPAEQHPELAVLVTAGLAAEHDWNDEFGIDLEDLGSEHSPGEYEGEAEADDGQVIKQWTTVVLGEDELTWLKKALQLNATER